MQARQGKGNPDGEQAVADGRVFKKRPQVRAACDSWYVIVNVDIRTDQRPPSGICSPFHSRKRKTACDAVRPTCGPCRDRNAVCRWATSGSEETRHQALRRDYETAKQSVGDMEHIVSFLRYTPPDQVMAFVNRLKCGEDVSALLASVTGSSGDDERQLYPANINTRMSPESSIGDDFLTSPTSATLLEDLRTPPSHQSSVASSSNHFNAFAAPTSPYFSANPGSTGRRDHPDYARFCDDRLQYLSIDHWTTVNITNSCAAAIISLYLETDHPILGFFDADLFITDLIDRRSNFCSQFLVVTLLFYASQAYAYVDWSVASLTPLLLKEAQSLWEDESKNDSILNACAAQILSLGCTCFGRYAFGTDCLRKGAAMAERLGLLGKEMHPDLYKSPRNLRAAAHISWGIFNYLTLRSIQYREDVIRNPPTLPIPGEQTIARLETEIAAPSSYMGDTFTALCKFWLLAHGVALFNHLEQPAIPQNDRRNLTVGEWIHQLLERWWNENAFIGRQDVAVPHRVVMLEIYLHSLILDIFRPFRARHYTLHDNASSNADRICAYSLEQLKRHVREHPAVYPSAPYSMIWHTALYYVVNGVLSDPVTEADSTGHFRLCAEAYVQLSRSFPVAQDILDGILAMGLKRNVISVPDARQLHFEAQQIGGRSENSDNSVMTLKLDLELAMIDPESATLSALKADLHEKFLFHDYTMGNY